MMSTEFPFLVTYFIRLSRHLNASCKLPDDSLSVYKNWKQILELKYPKNLNEAIKLIRSNVIRFYRAFRFNLRFLANVRIFSILVSSLFLILYMVGLFSVYYLLAVLTILFIIFRDGSNNWLPFPSYVF